MKAFPLFFFVLMVSCDTPTLTPKKSHEPRRTQFRGNITNFDSCQIQDVFIKLSTETDPVLIPVDEDGNFFGVVENLENSGSYACLTRESFDYEVVANYEFVYISNNRFICFEEAQDLEIEILITEPTFLEVKLFDDLNIDFEKVEFDAEFLKAPLILKPNKPLLIELQSNDRMWYKFREEFAPHESWQYEWIDVKPCEDNILMIPY